MEKIVTNCSQCPFALFDGCVQHIAEPSAYYICKHPNNDNCNDVILHDLSIIPTKCPLKLEELIIKLQSEENNNIKQHPHESVQGC